MTRIATILAMCAAIAAPVAAMDVKAVKSPGGISAYLNEDHGNQIVALSFYFAGGSALDPNERAGLSNFATALLDEGAGDKDSFEFQSELENRSIRWRVGADKDAIAGSITATTDNLDAALDLLALALTQPRFDAEPIDRIRKQILIKIKSDTENPNRIAASTLMTALFGDHPYGRNDDGTAETVAQLGADDFKAWAKARFARDRLIVAASGDITARQLGRALDRAFGRLPAMTGLATALPEAPIAAAANVVRVEKKLPQSVIYLGQQGIRRSDPDWYTAQVVDYVFGSGSFTSRLMDEIREKRGLAYSVFSSLQPLDVGAFVMAGAGTRAEAAEESIAVFRDEWRKLNESGITAEELQGAKDYLTGAWPLRFTATTRIADTLVAVQRDKLGLKYLDERNDLINKVTLEDANRVARRIYDPATLKVVVVGPANSGGGNTKSK
ncbi:MAG: insulinase family protein [Alphaproteobacteria bacterium]|nr:insulinase family protein [Alphaproteobacteria bacterium]